MDPALLAIVVFVLVLGVFALLGSADQRAVIERRLTESLRPSNSVPGLSVVRATTPSRVPWLMPIRQHSYGTRLGRNLMRAGLPVKAEEFILAQVVLTAVAGIAGVVLLRDTLGPVLAFGALALVGWIGPLIFVRFKIAQRVKHFELGLPEALDLVSGSLRAGYGIAHGVDMVAREMQGPTAEEFGQMLHEINLGESLEAALARLIERIESENVRLLATAVAVQRRTGGNLVEVLETLTTTIRDRMRIRREIQVITTAPRMSGYVVAALPVLAAGFMFFSSRYYFDVLVNEPLGRLLLVGSGLLVLVGLYINSRIVNIDV